MPEALSLEDACYALVLLEEICQGYDTGLYRRRFISALRASKIDLPQLPRWYSQVYPTTKLIDDLEDALERWAARKSNTAE